MISIITPTYNRADLLPRVYDSLLKQTCYDFEWIIIDDGSQDDTEQMIISRGWMNTHEFHVTYLKKKNGGKHTAINLGVEKALGELVFIVDSDDQLCKDSVVIVKEEFDKIRQNKEIGGVAGLDRYQNGKIVGTGLPQDYIDCNAMDIRYKYHVKGDMKEVFRTEVLKEYPFPVFDDERFCPEQLVWFRIARKYKMHYFNKPIYIAEYQADGITSAITQARMKSPVATCMTYAEMLDVHIPWAQKCKAAINYWRFHACLHPDSQVPIKWYWYLFQPMGYLMYKRDR